MLSGGAQPRCSNQQPDKQSLVRLHYLFYVPSYSAFLLWHVHPDSVSSVPKSFNQAALSMRGVNAVLSGFGKQGAWRSGLGLVAYLRRAVGPETSVQVP